MITRRRAITLAVVWTAPTLVFLAVAALAYRSYRIDVPARADAETRADAMAVVRAALDGAAPPAASPRLARALAGRGPAVAVAYLHGLEIGRGTGRGATWAEALAAAGAELARGPAGQRSAEERTQARIRLDVVVGRGPMPGPVLGTLALPGIGDGLPLNPGLEGIAGVVGGSEVVLLPHDVVSLPEKVVIRKRPFAFAPDLTVTSLDPAAANKTLPSGLTADVLYRVRTDSFVERPVADRAKGPVPLYRGNAAPPPLTPATLRAAALEGGRYLVDHLGPSGRYVYNHNLTTGEQGERGSTGERYSIPRHSGTTYFLAELYRLTKAEFLREPIERAFAHMSELIAAGGCEGTLPSGLPYACVIDRGDRTAVLGSTALSVVALAEYQRATGDARYQELATRLTNWILYLQRPDGSFRHRYDVKTRVIDEKTKDLYFTGEAALALARMTVVTGDPSYAKAAGRALDESIDEYDFFLGGFFYGEEHWTCIASEALFPIIKHDKYREFCDGYGAFLRQQQSPRGENPDQDDLAGAYNISPFVMPANTPAGSRTEAMLSAYQLDLHHGKPDPKIKAQILAALQYNLGQMVWPETDFAAAGTLRVIGAMPGSPTDRNVRIDFVQHVCSSMIRAAALLEQ